MGAGAGTFDSFDVTSQTRILGPRGLGGKTALTMKGGGSVASMQTVGGNASSLEQAGDGLSFLAPGTGGSLNYVVSDVVAMAGTGGYGSNALFAYDTSTAINVAVSGGAVGNDFGSAVSSAHRPARAPSRASASALAGHRITQRRHAEDRRHHGGGQAAR